MLLDHSQACASQQQTCLKANESPVTAPQSKRCFYAEASLHVT